MNCKTHKRYQKKVGRRLACGLLATLMAFSLSAFAQFTPSDDSYVNSKAASTNYGGAKTLDISSAGETTFIRFDLTAVPAGYTGASIAKATLKLYVNTVPTAGSFNVDLVNGTWMEKTIDYSNEPALGTTIAASVPLATSNKLDYVSIDITPAVVEWLNGTQPNDGIALVANSPLVATFDSKETTTTSHPPELDIVFASGGGTITGITTASGSGLTGGGTSGTLNLSLLTTCGSGQVLTWSGSAWACTNLSGGGTITGVTAGTDLTGGGKSGNVTLNLDTTKVPQLAAANTFAANQSITGSLSVSNGLSVTGDSFFGTSDTGTALQVSQGGASGTGAILGISRSNAAGSYAVLGTAVGTSGAVFGTEGSTKSAAGAGVVGVNGTGSVIGNKYGSSAGVWGDTGSVGLHGVIGTADNAYGVVGFNNSASGLPAIVGKNFGSSSIAPGLLAVSASPVGIGALGAGPTYSNNFNTNVGANAIGVVGDSAATGGIGVWGSTDNGTSVYGSTNTGTAVYGLSASGTGVLGSATSGIGVAGTSPSGGTAGVYGVTTNTDLANASYGVWGDDTVAPSNGAAGVNGGVYGYSQGGDGVVGITDSAPRNALFNFAGEFYAANNATPFLAFTPKTQCLINAGGDLICTGSKSAAVPLPDSRWVRLYAVESPENWFEDFGSGALSNGSASVALEPTFRDTVTSSQDYHVFLTPRGECEGLYIASTSASGFEVRELHHGTSNIAFDYRIVVRRKGYENIRMEDVTEMQKQIAAKREMLQRPRHRPAIVQPVTNHTQAEVQLPVPLRPDQLLQPNKLPTALRVQPVPAAAKR